MVQDAPLSEVRLGNLTVDFDGETAYLGIRRIDLSPRECRLLMEFARHAGRVLSRERLAEALRNGDAQAGPDRLSIHIYRLRQKLGGLEAWSIETIRKRGYALRMTARVP